MTQSLFPGRSDDSDDDSGDEDTPFPRRKKDPLPEPDELTGEVATVPGPDLSPAHTEDVDPPPGTDAG
ncbi:hypothetical protein [Amycolatopsis jejuensis]|uniref:hypothetical protein n=1 Tax=Amycolatopsis jejuensis TaxID=330084 RepID=UPI000524E8A3|nr:hypothetical protein [Amycolatopsis jejuensis]